MGSLRLPDSGPVYLDTCGVPRIAIGCVERTLPLLGERTKMGFTDRLSLSLCSWHPGGDPFRIKRRQLFRLGRRCSALL